MSRANPRKAVAALLPLAIRVSDSVSVAPMTLGMYAALERIASPLVTGVEPKDTLELIPSLYLLTHDPREVFRGNVLELAMDWANAQPVSVVEAIRSAAYRQMCAMRDVLPETEKKKRPRATGGSPRGSTSRQASCTGLTKTSSGRSRQARSRS